MHTAFMTSSLSYSDDYEMLDLLFFVGVQIWNLLTALALPACGYIGVRDNNVKCIQYFCCFNYMCAFCTFISLTSVIVLLANSTDDDNQTW